MWCESLDSRLLNMATTNAVVGRSAVQSPLLSLVATPALHAKSAGQGKA